MKCDRCNGQGFSVIAKWKCPVCGGKGVVEPMTEQEYLQSCNTEQLADVFFEYRYINATPQQQLWLSANEDFVKGGIVDWLKQTHTEKE